MRAVALAILGLAACTHERPLTELHELANERVTIETTWHESIDAVATGASDGISYASDRGEIPASNVVKVTEVRRGRGALEGAGIGFLAGATVGAIAGYADGDDHCDDSGGQWCIFVLSAVDKAVLGGVLLGGLSGIVGAVVGALVGSRDVYDYGEQVRVMPTGPPGSVGGATIQF